MPAGKKWELDILVAEDTRSDIELLELALHRCGEVRSLRIVKDGQELVDYLSGVAPFNQAQRQVPNIILMDLKMPRMDGLEVLAWLRRHPSCSVLPVVMMSSSGLTEDILQAYRLGVNAYFQKPADFAELEDILKSILRFWNHAKPPPVSKLPCGEPSTVP